jgi:hypothetical protein
LARELNAGMPNVFMEITANQVPKILQKPAAQTAPVKAVGVGITDDAIKPDTLQQTIERKLVADQVNSVEAATNVANQATQHESLAKWGRWSALVQQLPEGSDSINQVFSQIADLRIVDSNSVFGLAYSGKTNINMPDQGKFQFSLVAAEAYVKDKDAISRVAVKSGQLEIDFAQGLFNTQVAVALNPSTLESVKSQGVVDRYGRMSSTASLSNANISGIVLNKGLEATYLFDKSLASGGLLSGVAQWVR